MYSQSTVHVRSSETAVTVRHRSDAGDQVRRGALRVNLGNVRVGHTAKIWVDSTNQGNQRPLVSGGATQGARFRARFSIAKNLPVPSREDLTIPIIFMPHKVGPFHGLHKLTWRDFQGGHSLEVPISGTGVG